MRIRTADVRCSAILCINVSFSYTGIVYDNRPDYYRDILFGKQHKRTRAAYARTLYCLSLLHYNRSCKLLSSIFHTVVSRFSYRSEYLHNAISDRDLL